jgi:catechol 2,3-dioxygenase-like lactoylglutathione lyase family enzyme
VLLSGNLQGVQHLGVFVPDIEKAIAFYSDKLKFSVEDNLHISADAGDIKIAFVERDGMVIELVQLVGEALEEVKSRGNGHIDHFALDVLDIQDAIQTHLERGIALHPSTAGGPKSFPLFAKGVNYVFFSGPFTEKIEFIQALHLDPLRRDENVGGWNHLGVPVTDLEQSKAFYRQFGFEEIAYGELPVGTDKKRISMIEKDGFSIELYQLVGEALEEIKTRKDGLIDHIALKVLDADQAYQDLKNAGYDIIEEAPVFLPLFERGVKYFMVRGPMGEKIEFNQVL